MKRAEASTGPEWQLTCMHYTYMYYVCNCINSRILRVIHQVALFEMPLMEPTEVKNMKGINGNMVSKTDILADEVVKTTNYKATGPQ